MQKSRSKCELNYLGFVATVTATAGRDIQCVGVAAILGQNSVFEMQSFTSLMPHKFKYHEHINRICICFYDRTK